MNTLHALQRKFQAALAGDARALADDAKDVARRVAIHRTTIETGLRLTLRSTYPATCRIVGVRTFDTLVSAFVAATPQTNPILACYGDGFPAFIATQSLPTAAPYLADIASLEWARHEAYRAADRPTLDDKALEAIDPDALDALRLALHPATRILSSPFPLHHIWRINQPDVTEVPTIDLSASEAVAVTRPTTHVITRKISRGDAALLQAIADGATLGASVAAAQQAEADFDLETALAAHIVNGAFAAH